MSQLIQLNAGDAVVFDLKRQAWFADDGEPLSARRTARATLGKPVNFYDSEGVRSHNIQFTITQKFDPAADA